MPEEYKCQMCGGTFATQDELQRHNGAQHSQQPQQPQQQPKQP